MKKNSFLKTKKKRERETERKKMQHVPKDLIFLPQIQKNIR